MIDIKSRLLATQLKLPVTNLKMALTLRNASIMDAAEGSREVKEDSIRN